MNFVSDRYRECVATDRVPSRIRPAEIYGWDKELMFAFVGYEGGLIVIVQVGLLKNRWT